MKENSVARRYALGLIKAITDAEQYETIIKELQFFSQLLAMNSEFKTGLETFLFNKDQKMTLMDSLKKKANLNQKSYQFILTLIEENRLSSLDTIIATIKKIWNEKNDILQLTLHSAITLNKDLETELVKSLEKSFKKRIILEKKIDKELIAGIKIQKGSVFYDFSIAGNLVKLKEALLEE